MLLGKSVSIVSWACVCRLSTYGTQLCWPVRRKQVVLSATEYPAVVRMLERQRPLVAGWNETVIVPLCACRTVRNRLPAVIRSEVVRDRSKLVNTPAIQVIEADGVNVRSSVLFRATAAGRPNAGCAFSDCTCRYPTRAATLDTSFPTSFGDGLNDQLMEPFGHSRVRLVIAICSSVRSIQMTPRVSRYVAVARRPSGKTAPPPVESVVFCVADVASTPSNWRKPSKPPSAS